MKTLKICALVGLLVALIMLPASSFIIDLINQGEYDAGFDDGILYAIENMELWTVEVYNPDNPAETLRPDGYDLTIYIELDGEIYEHGATQC